ncbi:60S ribosomal protein L35Ae [Penicillium diatomitis]|uniref:60S ribosomal protein L35Ae n=1 Tax=Penicillium diatomitis TaxID=2819901 RepID=A0A9W9WU17_9EURO|nr:60S ribosomal protein L35Ae [Penicillium diatomitis]KAJ5475532.1 60S ribosomal protein L35Ae [Penicillium diatomitis]
MPSEQGHRLYVKGRHLSYQRGKHNLNPNTSLVQIEGVTDPKAASFYLGKKVAFVYRAKREVRGSNIRVIWGKVTRPHGNSGVVRAKFRHNLPPQVLRCHRPRHALPLHHLNSFSMLYLVGEFPRSFLHADGFSVSGKNGIC